MEREFVTYSQRDAGIFLGNPSIATSFEILTPPSNAEVAALMGNYIEEGARAKAPSQRKLDITRKIKEFGLCFDQRAEIDFHRMEGE